MLLVHIHVYILYMYFCKCLLDMSVESWHTLCVLYGLGKCLLLWLVICKQLFKLAATVGDVFRFTGCEQTGCNQYTFFLNSCSWD